MNALSSPRNTKVAPRSRRLGLILTLLCAASSAYAGGAWFTSRTTDGQSKPLETLSQQAPSPDAAVAPERITFAATGLPRTIPDNNAVGVTSNLAVTVSGPAAELTVSYRITHPYIGDLKVTLIAPSGGSYILWNRSGGTTHNLFVTDLDVSVANGEGASGAWRLLVQDLDSEDTGTLDSWSLTLNNSGRATVDLAMTLTANPQGDDDGNHQVQPNSAAQDKWERIIQHFADGVYESTNAAHKIRNVRVFRSGRAAANADVLWTPAGHPNVPSKGGVGEKGGHINMYEIFTGGGPGRVDYPMLADEKGSGYTQAHEWGHFFYGVYDEYRKAAADIPVAPSIMNSQWTARGGDLNWLNFSIAYRGGGPFQDTLHNNQHAQHGASAWKTLARPTSRDIRPAAQLPLGRRIYYPEVAAAAPAGINAPAINLPGMARSALNIIWMSDQDVYEVIIDHSDSMRDENKMAQAKAAAKLLINLLPLGKSRVGVLVFDNTVTEIQPIIPLNVQADKDRVKAKIELINPGNSTAIGDAAQTGLSKVLASNLTKSNRVVFLLSDGINTTGVAPLSVVPSYQNAQIPLFTFAFGSDADILTMRALAVQTGGKFYNSRASLAAITTAFHDAQNVASAIPSLSANTLLLGSGSGSGSFVVDSTISQLNLSLVAPTGLSSHVQLRNPSGAVVAPNETLTVSGEALLSHTIINPPAGTWTIVTPPNSSGAIAYTASGIPNSLTYCAGIASLGGETVSYPTPIKLRARLFKELQINRATVNGQVIAPDGAVRSIQFHDDGAGGDEVAMDGNYTAIYQYNQTGTYTFKVNYSANPGQAYLTYKGATNSATVDGLPPASLPDRPIAEAFTRANQIQVKTVGGLLANISTRMQVGTGDNVLIAGFIILGTEAKDVVVRGIGPSLASFGLSGLLADPTIELHDATGRLIASNNDWRTNPNFQGLIDNHLAPRNNKEAALLITLNPGPYTVILRGTNNTTGLGLVEAYSLNQALDAKFANISTRGLVQTGDNVMIGGIIVGGIGPTDAVVRALGPSLANAGVRGVLQDPVLELHNSNGAIVASNDDWNSGPRVNDLRNLGLAPTNSREAALLYSFAPGAYTAIVRGYSGSTGVALVEVFHITQ